MQTIKFTSTTAAEIEIRVALESNMVAISATIDGQDIGQITGGLVPISHPVAVARLGRLALRQEHADLVSAAITAVEGERVAHTPTAHEAEMMAFDLAESALRARMSREG